jgi:hypothetical protein
VLPVPPVSARCHRCLIPSSPFRTLPLSTGPDVARPHLSADAPVSAHAAPHPSPPLSAPSPTPTWHRADPHPSPSSPRLCSKESHPTPPRSPLFFSPLLSFSHGQASPPHVRASDRATVTLLGTFPTATIAIFPLHGETRKSAAISLFGAALTSLVLPCSSQS